MAGGFLRNRKGKRLAPNRHANFRALLIEDNRIWQEMIPNLLDRADGWHYELHIAGTLKEGLVKLAELKPDVLALDMQLPDAADMHGLTTIRLLYPELPICMITAEASYELAVAALRAGAQDYLFKSDQLTGEVIARSLYFAIERQKWRNQLSRAAAALRKRYTDMERILRDNDEGVPGPSDEKLKEFKQAVSGLKELELELTGAC